MNAANQAVNGSEAGPASASVVIVTDNDVDMHDSDNSDGRTVSNGSSSATNGTCVTNGVASDDLECDMGKCRHFAITIFTIIMHSKKF